jgi:hypothetical protein
MKYFFIYFIFLTNCSKPKTVLICGDHVCIIKLKQNNILKKILSIEVKIIDKKEK